MKTLDEVIKTMDHVEFCCTNCKLQFDCDEVECILEDALHYLKEYKNTDENYREAITHVNKIIDHYEKMVADYLSTNNPALSWDELRTMEGKPVWVEKKTDDGNYCHWGIIKGFVTIGDDWMHLCGFLSPCHKFSFARQQQGISWQAYRKERTNGLSA